MTSPVTGVASLGRVGSRSLAMSLIVLAGPDSTAFTSGNFASRTSHPRANVAVIFGAERSVVANRRAGAASSVRTIPVYA